MTLTWTTYLLPFLLHIALIKGDIDYIWGIITCDSNLTFYADGKFIVDGSTSSSADKWSVSDVVRIPSTTQVYAIKCISTGDKAGIIAAFSANTVTDNTWKCNGNFYTDWETVGFDDSDWADAHVIGKHGISPWGFLPGVNTVSPISPQWIWTTRWIIDQPDPDRVVYCRKTIEVKYSEPDGCTFTASGNCTKAGSCGLGLVAGTLNCGAGVTATNMRCCCRPCKAGGNPTNPPPYLCREVLPPFDKKDTNPMCQG